MGHKTTISFNLRKYVEKHSNGPVVSAEQNKNKANYNTDYIFPDSIDFFWR